MRTKEKRLPLKLFGIYQSISDDLVFWCIFDVLILSLVKGFTAVEISIVFTVSYWASMLLHAPSYYLSRKIRPGGSIILGAILFFTSAVLITFGQSLPVIIVGQCLYRIAASFQKMSLVILKNAVDATNQNDKYLKVMAAANSVYSVISFATAVSMSFLFQINHNLPMYICIGISMVSLFLSLIISRYDDKKELISTDFLPGRKDPMLDKTTIFCLVLSVLGIVIFTLAENNLRILLEKELSDLFGVEKEVFLFAAVMIGSRAAKLLGNTISYFTRNDNISRRKVFTAIVVMTISIPFIGLLSAVRIGLAPVVFAGTGILIKAMIYDSYKVYLSYFMMARLKKKKMVMVLYIDSLATNLFNSLFSSIVTLIITFHGVYGVMIFLAVLSTGLLACFILFQKYLVREYTVHGYRSWKQEEYSGVDSLLISAAVLMNQYNISESTPVSIAKLTDSVETVDVVSRRFHFEGYYPYSEEKLYELYQKGHPCAICVKTGVNREPHWLPVLFLDQDGGIVWNFGSYDIFINQFPEITEICSFVIK